ncbi:nucleotidyltransferase family protein [Pseudotabrizicola formosa]|uniref:nucleotidyltransferase family protein n=1 Tax=Pseudotabrizicola formosa TaxID=2030009 RepID=UPI000CD0AD9B|nr:nucleotidyltransferase family protein [Pseudotabrizicola formosa]
MPISTPDLQILILAAGASRRMRGTDKLLQPVAGQPLLRHIAGQALATGLAVTVTLPPDRPARAAALSGLPIRHIPVADAQDGLAQSLRAGLASLPPQQAVMVLLADLPEITTADLMQMARAYADAPDQILRATDASGQPGHPVIFPASLRAELMQLSGDDGARALLRRHAGLLRLIALPDRHATTDLDTPEDWATWRSGRE